MTCRELLVTRSLLPRDLPFKGGGAAAVKTEAAPIKVETKVQETKEYDNCRIQVL